MTRGGKRPGAGRPPGSASAKTRKVANKVNNDGEITPLEVMVETMRELWDKGEKVEACSIAKDCAPYVHARLASTEMKMDGKVRQFVVSDTPMTEDEWQRTYGSGVATAARSSESTH